MMNLFELYDDIRQSERANPLHAALQRLGRTLRRLYHHLPVNAPSEEDFLSALGPHPVSNIAEFLEAQAARPAPWDGVSKDDIPDSVMAVADDAVEGRFSCLGTVFRFEADVDWHRAAEGNGTWPRKHWAHIFLGDSAQLGDVKPCWELNRHAFFVSLALAWRRTGDDKYAATFARLLNSWCDQNPPETGICYISGLNIGLRCLSWIVADRLFQGAGGYDAATQTRLHCNLLAQARHMAAYLTARGRTGFGHMPACEAALLAWLSLRNPAWHDAEKWLARALAQLWPAFDDRIYPDGLHFECSFGYQLQMVECLSLLFSEMRRQKRPIPARNYTMLEKMTTVLRVARQPGGALPDINDDDGGYVFPLPLDRQHRLQGVLSAMAVLYDRPDFKSSSAETLPFYARMVLGAQGAEDYRLIARYSEDFPRLTHLVHSRIALMRRAGDFFLFKNNPDPFPQSGHNHADLLSLILHLDGRAVLCDSGTYRYTNVKGYRNVLRSTQAHNTICVDGQGQSTPQLLFSWRAPLQAGDMHTRAFEDMLVLDAAHASFHAQGVTHRRVLVWLKHEGALLVIDKMEGAHTHTFEQFWHFAPGTQTAAHADNRFSLSTAAGEALATVSFFRNDERDTLETLAASDVNKQCYRSAVYGELKPATALAHRWTSALAQDSPSHRATLFCKPATSEHFMADFADVGTGVFRFNAWTIDLNQTPAAVTRAA